MYQPKPEALVTGSQNRIARAGKVPAADLLARWGGIPSEIIL